MIPVITNILSSGWGPLAISASVFALFLAVGKFHASQSLSDSLSLRLMGASQASSWLTDVIRSFDRWFGEHHLSLRCIITSALTSILAVAVISVALENFGNLQLRTNSSVVLWKVIAFGLLINIIPDYISLWQTRVFLNLFSHVDNFFLQLLIIAIDLILTALIIIVSLKIFLSLRGEDVAPADFVAILSIYAIFFYSTFLTSFWAWWFFVSHWVLRIFTGTAAGRLLNIEEKPWAQAGLVAAALTGAIAGIGPIALENAKNRSDQLVCLTSTSSSCSKAIQLGSGEERAFKLAGLRCTGTEPKCAFETVLMLHGAALTTPEIYSMACKEGLPRACALHGIHLHELAPQRAMAMFEEACSAGEIFGCAAQALGRDAAASDDFVTGQVELQEAACRNGHLIGCDQLIISAPLRAIGLFDRHCALGELWACKYFGRAFRNVGSPIAPWQTNLMEKDCGGGKQEACVFLGIALIGGYGRSPDATRGFELLEGTCEKGVELACVALARRLQSGKGKPANPSEAFAVFSKDCALGNRDSCYNIGRALFHGLGTNRDYEQAAEFLAAACDDGSAAACNLLGIATLDGLGVARDDARAMELFEESCAGGFIAGCFTIQTLKRKENN